tara:strand:+ start:140 stop:532 length:393 start_codon:yes stop_codon:yes gene_type:complete
MEFLPDDVLGVIYKFIPTEITKNLTKKKYLNYTLNHIEKWRNFDPTIRKIIKKDYNFLLDIQFQKRYKKWKKLTRWRYKGMIYPHYVEYINQLCKENHSIKCQEIVFKYNGDSSKKKYKKVLIRNIRWKN